MTTLLSTVDAPPRYIPNDPRPSLIGLTRAGLAEVAVLADIVAAPIARGSGRMHLLL